jgi:hypothetical protein
VHWACAKIKAAEDEKDSELGQLIVTKLSVCPGISYNQIATTAHHAGRRQLATMVWTICCDIVGIILIIID